MATEIVVCDDEPLEDSPLSDDPVLLVEAFDHNLRFLSRSGALSALISEHSASALDGLRLLREFDPPSVMSNPAFITFPAISLDMWSDESDDPKNDFF
jgi:hypothetical protein